MPTVEILIDGTDYAPIIVFESARFESLVNGQPGRGYIRVRDDDRTLAFTGGETVALKIDGDFVWRGFVMQPKRVYIAPALNIDDFGLTRFIDLECTDINVLFKKRIVFNQSDPDNVYGTLFPPGTADLTALEDLFDNFLDLSGDGLDTTTLVENVADINVDQEARAWSGSYLWSQAMQSIAMLPGAIWYIDPDKNVVYTDVDTPNAPFGLSDQPNGTTTRGYANMEIVKDGTVMANDVLAWGAGYGSQTPVFKREIDATSVSTHGVWQRGEIKFGVYKQATIDRIAESIVYGSPSNKRGSKDDRITVALTTYEGGLRPAQKVDFTSNVFGFNDVIPVRKMIVTFEAPDDPLYTITLSHEIDPPWSFIDPFFLQLPGLPPPKPPEPPGPPDVKRVCIGTGECLFEDWDRTLSMALGNVSSTGQAWENITTPNSGTAGVTLGFVYSDKSVTVSPASSLFHGELDPIDLANRDVFHAPFTLSTSVEFSTSILNGLEGDGVFFVQVSSGQASVSVSINADWFSGVPRLLMRAASQAGITTQTLAWPGGVGDPASSTVRMIVTDTSVTLEAFGLSFSQNGLIGDLPGDIDTLRLLEFTIGGSALQQAMRVSMGPIVIMSDFGVPMPWCSGSEVETCYDVLVGFPFFQDIDHGGETELTTGTAYMTSSLLVLVNGLIQRPGVDYNETDPSTGDFELLFTPAETDSIRVIYRVAP